MIITGHLGLIGSALLKRHPSAYGWDVKEPSKPHPDGQFGIMYHLGAHCRVVESIEDPNQTFILNCFGTHSWLERARHLFIPKVVFTSSQRVLHRESNPYVASKNYGESLCKAYGDAYGIDYSIVRPSCVYGPHFDTTQRVIHKYIIAALNNHPLTIYGDRNKMISPTYIDDFLDGMEWATKQRNSTTNINAKSIRMTELAEIIRDTCGSKSAIQYGPPEPTQPQTLTVHSDYKCSTSIEDGIKLTVKYYQSQRRKEEKTNEDANITRLE